MPPAIGTQVLRSVVPLASSLLANRTSMIMDHVVIRGIDSVALNMLRFCKSATEITVLYLSRWLLGWIGHWQRLVDAR